MHLLLSSGAATTEAAKTEKMTRAAVKMCMVTTFEITGMSPNENLSLIVSRLSYIPKLILASGWKGTGWNGSNISDSNRPAQVIC
jgi:hypothetical protein